MILYIDTTDYNQVTFALAHQGKLKKKSYRLRPQKSFEILAKLDEFLKKSKIPALSPSKGLNSKSEIKKIMVNKGPGSFMGIRVGLAMAMALGLAWHIPVHPVKSPPRRGPQSGI